MLNNKKVIEGLYNAYQKNDPEEMASFYDPKAVFTDQIFGTVKGEDIKKVWKVVHSTTTDFFLKFHIISVSPSIATANSYLTYKFKHTNKVINISVKSHFRLANGKIISQTDEYSMWSWMNQAFGLKGLLLGWSPWMIKKVQNSARNNFRSF